MATKNFYLKPCPVCGELKAETTFEESTSLYRIICSKCGLKSGLYPDLTLAVSAWNRRFRDACLEVSFPQAPWKFFLDPETNHYILAQTNEKFEAKRMLLEVEMLVTDSSSDSDEVSKQEAELILRLLTASPVMYTKLVNLVKLLEENKEKEIQKAIKETKEFLIGIYPETSGG